MRFPFWNLCANPAWIFTFRNLCPFENEAGIFYYRYPDQDTGNISGIVHKEFLQVRGDGIRDIRGLLENNPRAILQLKRLEMEEPEMLATVVPREELFVVVPYGNHARGALFLDDSDFHKSGADPCHG